MNKIIAFVMYLMWIITIVMILAATFTNFEFEDLNIIAIVLFVFSLLNSFFVIAREKRPG